MPLPRYPDVVALITSAAGAAVHDMIRILGARWPMATVKLLPVRVQGAGAAQELAGAVRYANQWNLADLIIIGRGGGSMEDLWAFNEEVTVRAVADYRNFAADVRAATPSQAAELVVADVEGYKQRVAYLEQRARSLLSALLTQQQRRLDNLVNSWALRDPERLFADQAQRLDTASRRLREALELHLQQDEHKLALSAARLDSLSPLAVLARGYSVSQKSDYTLVSSVDELKWGDELLTTVADGVITSVVQQVERR